MDKVEQIEAILKEELEDPCKYCEVLSPSMLCLECNFEFRADAFHDLALVINDELI